MIFISYLLCKSCQAIWVIEDVFNIKASFSFIIKLRSFLEETSNSVHFNKTVLHYNGIS